MIIHILRLANENGVRVQDDVDESALIHLDKVEEDDEKIVETTEYCLVGCQGSAHITGIPDAVSHFCNRHVHRSGHATVKRWPVEAKAEAQSLV